MLHVCHVHTVYTSHRVLSYRGNIQYITKAAFSKLAIMDTHPPETEISLPHL